jgi:HK97 family phage major capsid protein
MSTHTYAEQISAYEHKLAANTAAMDDLGKKSSEEGRTFDASEQEEFDGYVADNDELKGHLKRLHILHNINVQNAKEVRASTSTEASASRAPSQYRAPIQIKRQIEKGTGFIRLMAARWIAQQEGRPAYEIAQEKWGDTPEVAAALKGGVTATNWISKAAVAAGTTESSDWASPLVITQNLASEFLDALRPATILGRIPGLRMVPFNIQVPRTLTDPTGYWVGQGDQKPMSSMTFDSVTLDFHKLAAIVAITEELARFSSPSAEQTVRTALMHALTYRMDRDLLDPDIAAVTAIKPASLTNGVTPTAASGTTAAAFRQDFGDMMATFLGLNMSPSGLVLVMTSAQAMRLSLMRNSLGNKEFPDIGIAGGALEGIPVITSENIVASGGSPTDGYPIVAINAPEILVADDGGVSIDISREASVQMNDAPDSPETTSTVLVSFWQRNYIGIKAERFVTWKKGRTGAVQFISHAKYEES